MVVPFRQPNERPMPSSSAPSLQHSQKKLSGPSIVLWRIVTKLGALAARSPLLLAAVERLVDQLLAHDYGGAA